MSPNRIQMTPQTYADITGHRRIKVAPQLTQFCVDQAAQAVILIAPDGRILYANELACGLFGYSGDEMIAMMAYDIDPDCTATEWPVRWESLRNIGAASYDARSRRKDGTIVPVAVTVSYSLYDGSEYAFAFVQDISSRVQREAALAAEKHLFDILMENVPDHIYFKDLQSRFTRISSAHARLFGLNDPAEAIGKSDFDFFSEAHARPAFEDEQEILRSGQPMLGKAEREIWADGRETWVATAKMPLTDLSGQIVGTFGISRNITRSKLAEQALRASEEFNKRILESSSDGLCVLDLDGSLLYLSALGRKLLGLDDYERVPPLRWLSFWEGTEKQKSESALFSAASGGVGAYQASLRNSKGIPMLWDIVISPITNATGRVERLVCVFRDITERRLLDNQLAQAQKLESIGQLAAGIAHEINTPIQYIGDNAKFLGEAFQDLIRQIPSVQAPVGSESRSGSDSDLEYLREEIPNAIAQLLEGVERVACIVRGMKEFSHPGSPEKTLADINRAIESTVLVSQNEWKYCADLTADYDRSLPLIPCLIGEFNQVILNLIVNAAHAIRDVVGNSGQKGAIQIITRRNGSWVEVLVSDTGTGIPEAIQSKVFDPFFTTKPVGRGTGQGLAIAHAVIVGKHSGTISFETAAGSGTTFRVRLPLPDETEES
jgi:PAS domain S-box-containing protein